VLAPVAVRAGRFDLLPGTWWAREKTGEKLYLRISAPPSRELALSLLGRGQAFQVRGTYRVRAVKGQYHVGFTVVQAPPQGRLLGAPLAKGQEIPMVLDYHQGGVRLTVFDRDNRVMWTRDLVELSR
jgi:hypothetical protein